MILIDKTKVFVKFFIKFKFIRFLLVGVINTIFGYGIYVICLFIGFNYKYAALISIIIGILFNFQTIGKIVFKNKNNLLIIKFTLVYVIVYFININIIGYLNNRMFNSYINGAIAAFFVAIISFLLMKTVVFRGVDD